MPDDEVPQPLRAGDVGVARAVKPHNLRSERGGDVQGVSGENIYALCDVDANHLGEMVKRFPNAKVYRDYREMLDKEHKNLDAVTVTTPDHMHASIALRAMERNGLIRTLAEPNLTALSGETAKFLAGGEFPIPVAQQDRTVTIQFKSFGVATAFKPIVMSDGRISLAVSAEVSEISPDGRRVAFVATRMERSDDSYRSAIWMPTVALTRPIGRFCESISMRT